MRENSIVKKERDSNIELLRIIAMLLVLVLHAGFWSIGAPSTENVVSNPIDASIRVFLQSLSIISVNIFVMISGWFGIRLKIQSVFNFLFVCFYYLIGLYALSILCEISTFSLDGIKVCLMATKDNWFVKVYLMLMILSPVLNAFIDNAGETLQRNVIISLFCFLFIYGWIFPSATKYIAGGYSPSLFVGLYLLARYLNVNQPYARYKHYFKIKYVISFTFLISILVALIYIVPTIHGVNTINVGRRLISYLSPITILVSSIWLISFSLLKLKSRVINVLANSSFPVFLIHTNTNFREYYKSFFFDMYCDGLYNYIIVLVICVPLLYLSIFFLDQIRVYIWIFLSKKIHTMSQ